MPAYSIRPRRSEDIANCAEVLKRVYQLDGYPVQGVDHALEFLSGPHTLEAWVATSDAGNIVGHIAMSSSAKTDLSVELWKQQHSRVDNIAVLERLFVDPGARGQGVAEALMRAVTAAGQERGLRVVLFALEKDQGAMRLYEKVGWRTYGTQRYRYGDGKEMDAVCYVSPAS